MAELQKNRWQTSESDFAVRLELDDVEGFFSKKLIIEPGTRALFLEKGELIGEVPPGEHTLQGLMDRLAFWIKKSTVVILTRGEEVLLDLECNGLPTKEMLVVEVKLRLAVRMEDVALFFKNMMGGRAEFTKDDLRSAILPIVHQALFEAVGRLSIRDLTGDQARGDLEATVSQALGSSLSREGLGFGRIQTLSVCHPEYDAHHCRTGETWLHRLDLEHQKETAKLEADRIFAKIDERRGLDDLEGLAQQVAADRMEGDLAAKLRRIGIRKQWRAAVLAEEFDKIQSQEELVRFLKERDKDRLIQQDEYDTLASALGEKTQDRSALRQHLLRKLEVEQRSELDALRSSIDYDQKKRTKQHEINLAILSDSEEARKWKANIELEMQQAAERRAEELKRLEHSRAAARVSGTGRREEELAESRHQVDIDRIRGEMEIGQVERRRRIALVEAEMEKSRLDDKEARDRRGAEWQLERWQKIRSIKDAAADRTRQQMHQQRIETIQAHRGMSASELMAVSDNASVIADVEKHRATNAEVEQLRGKLADAHKAGSEGTIAALQQSLEQFGKLADNITRNLSPQAGSRSVGPASAGGQGPVFCASCRAENELGDRCCRQCGKAL